MINTVFIEAETGGGVSLRIAIYKEGSFLRNRARCGQIYRCSGFANATFLVGNTYNMCHI